MVITIVIVILVTILLAGYALFTQKHCYVHHTALFSATPEAMTKELSQLEYWPSWLPWGKYDDQVSIQVIPHNQEHDCAIVQLNSAILGFVECRIPTQNEVGTVEFQVHLSKLYSHPINIKIQCYNVEEQHPLLHITAQVTLGFWQRYKQASVLRQLSGDMRLLLIQLCARFAPNQIGMPKFQLLENKSLANVDAVTRPFIVEDHAMSMKMEQGFRDLFTSLGPDNPPAGPSFALYETADLRLHYFTGKLGVPIQCLSPCEAQPEKVCFKGLYLGLKYQGDYESLWLAWHVLHTHRELLGLKSAKRRLSLEIYEVSPRETTNKHDFVTVIYTPLR